MLNADDSGNEADISVKCKDASTRDWRNACWMNILTSTYLNLKYINKGTTLSPESTFYNSLYSRTGKRERNAERIG